MSLQIWLPLNQDLRNQGLTPATISGGEIDNNGKLGKCYKVKNTSYITITHTLPTISNFSFAFWMKIPSNMASGTTWERMFIFSAINAAGGSNSTTGINWANYDSVKIYDDANHQWLWAYPGTQFEYDTWNHWTITHEPNGEGVRCKVYINGNLINTYNSTTHPLQLISGTIKIGDGIASDYLYINDFRLYDHTLSPKEVEEINKGLVLHYKLDDRNIESTTNLIAGNSAATYDYVEKEVAAYATSILSKTQFENKIYTFTAYIKNTSDHPLRVRVSPYNADDSDYSAITGNNIQPGEEGYSTVTVDLTDTASYNGKLVLYIQNGNAGTVPTNKIFYVKEAQFEQKNHATPFTISSRSQNTVYDSSGFNNNATATNITVSNSSARCSNSFVFSGSSSYVKVTNNNWLTQGMQEITINFWAKCNSWPSNGGRMISCTETGGFNLEAGNSGYYRFPVHVYTDAEQTATAYKYDSKEIQISKLSTTNWNMITLIYTTSGTKTYINGQLHHTYTNASYGIHFNTSARLFLGCEANTASATTPYFNGQLNDLRIYAKELTAAQILELYNVSATIDNFGNAYSREVIEQ